MKLVDSFNEICRELSRQTEAAILAGDYEVIQRDEFTTTIKANELLLEIWMVNDPETTHLYSFRYPNNDYTGHFFMKSLKFKDPERCRAILSQLTPDEQAALKTKYQQEIEETKKKLEELS